MEWPIFQMPYLGNRLLIAIIGVIHVCISHGMAVGGSFFVVLLHYRALRDNNKRLGDVAFRILKIFFIVTTSAGALTGVGIWFVTATVSPASIGSLLYVFFWAWFAEWIVFVTEVILILLYFLGWRKYGMKTGFRFGVAYVVVSWLTMMIITGILGAKLTPGNWLETHSFWAGFFNPSYLPQLLTRTSIAALLSVAFSLFILRFLKSYQDQWENVCRLAGKSFLIVSPVYLFAILSYYNVLPQEISHLLGTALMTLKYSNYAYLSKIFFFVIVLFLIVSGLILVLKKKDYRFLAFVPLLLLIFAVGQFERVREFLRKPYTIHKYLYSNGIRESEAPFLNQSGVLKYAGWAKRSAKETDPVLRKGELLFKLECANCHTYNGVNGITKKKRIIQDVELTDNFLRTYKRSHPYMPPFIGTEEERQALAVYLDHLVNKSP